MLASKAGPSEGRTEGSGFVMPVKVAIVDYGSGNLFSIQHACRIVGLNGVLTVDGREFDDAQAIILPGVGAFAAAMERLKQAGLSERIHDWAVSGKPLIGICLGLQLLMAESLEHGRHKGLGLIEGCVLGFREKFPDRSIRVPNIGWRPVYLESEHSEHLSALAGSPLDGLNVGEEFYFVHSYYVEVTEQGVTRHWSDFEDFRFCCAVAKDNIFGFQFHPERSARQGLEVIASIRRLLEVVI